MSEHSNSNGRLEPLYQGALDTAYNRIILSYLTQRLLALWWYELRYKRLERYIQQRRLRSHL